MAAQAFEVLVTFSIINPKALLFAETHARLTCHISVLLYKSQNSSINAVLVKILRKHSV